MGGTIEMRARYVAKNYLRTWFFLDSCVMTISWIYVVFAFVADASGQAMSVTRNLKGLQAIRLLRLAKLQKLADNLMDMIKSSALSFTIKISKLLFMIFG